MVELIVQMESPYTVTGEMTKKAKKGETVEFNLTLNGDPTAPEMTTKIAFTVYGPADPMTDYSDPVWVLDGEQIDARTYTFPFPSGGSMSLDVFIAISSKAKWFKELRTRVDVVPC